LAAEGLYFSRGFPAGEGRGAVVTAMRVPIEMGWVFMIAFEFNFYCAPEGLNYMQMWFWLEGLLN
jgi:hypothetical protein